MPREILVDWTTSSGAGKVSVFQFIAASDVAAQRAALAAFLGAVDAELDSGTSWSIRTAGREVLAADGSLLGAWTDSPIYSGVGGISGEPVADSTQALVRWLTDHIVGNRFLQGRTFIPGLSATNLSDGNIDASAGGTIQIAATALIAASVQLAVWHRPIEGAGGVEWAVDTASVNTELAVLRRRRG